VSIIFTNRIGRVGLDIHQQIKNHVVEAIFYKEWLNGAVVKEEAPKPLCFDHIATI